MHAHIGGKYCDALRADHPDGALVARQEAVNGRVHTRWGKHLQNAAPVGGRNHLALRRRNQQIAPCLAIRLGR